MLLIETIRSPALRAMVSALARASAIAFVIACTRAATLSDKPKDTPLIAVAPASMHASVMVQP